MSNTIKFETKYGWAPILCVYPDPEDKLKKPNVIVTEATTVNVEFRYPLNKPVVQELITSNLAGFTRAEFLRQIVETYQRIYQEERETMSGEESLVSGLLNRETSDGKYGIWGHGLEDLALDSATFKDGVWHLTVES